MRGYILKRLGLTLISLLLVSIIIFAASNLLPGDVGRTILGPYASQAQVDALNHQLGVDQPLLTRYLSWLGDFVTGHWGDSQLFNVPVASLVLGRLGNSALLGCLAMVLVVPIAVGAGVAAALKRGRLTDRVVSLSGLTLIALPEFVIGILLVIVFAVNLKWFPVTSDVPQDPLDVVRQLALPAIPLMCMMFGYLARMSRAGTIDALQSDYTRTAVLKGLPTRVVLSRHVLRNAMLPTVTVIGVQIGYLIGGMAVIETLFSYPGIGKLVIDSAKGHDLPTLQASIMLIALIFMTANLLVDLAYALFNPRVRVAEAA